LLDPNDLDKTGKTAIDFFCPSRDGKLVAVSLSERGSEAGTLYLYETATGKKFDDAIPRIQLPTAGGDVAWNADSTGFFYTRYPRADERPKADLDFYQQVYFHKLGTLTDKDTYVIGKGFPRIAEIVLDTSEDGRFLLVTMQKGDGGEFEHHLLGPDGKWTQLTHYADNISSCAFGRGDDASLYLFSYKDAPRGKILRLSLTTPDLAKAETVVKESAVAIDGFHWTTTRYGATFVPTKSGLYVLDIDGGPAQMRFCDRAGNLKFKVPLPNVCAVKEILPVHEDEILIHAETFVDPPAWYTFRPGDEKLHPTALYKKSPADFSDAEVVREFAVSKDGTKVPLTVVRRKGTKLDGANSTLLTGYGGFGISSVPRFSVQRAVWLEQGGVFVIANLRGGADYGEDWHKAGNLTKKQNVFDDFAACAQHLIDRKYTSRDKLAIEGRSNGGLLMGAALTQHPELYRAVVSGVGIYDMLRLEQHPNGAFNVTEYGTVKDPAQFRALFDYSPYQHVKDDVAYPAALLVSGANDGRADPFHSKKMAARLQAASSSKLPVLLYVSPDAGHGLDDNLSERVDRAADTYAFLFEQLGMKYQPPH
jgi:prolyl oligopeptidase